MEKLFHEIQIIQQELLNLNDKVPPVPSLNEGATLHPYQHDCFSWLWRLHALGYSGILADEMGLGKTVQSLAFLYHLFRRSSAEGGIQRALIVAPLSLMFNWQAEIQRFVPLHCFLYLGDQAERMTLRQQFEGQRQSIQILLTTPDLLLRDQDWLSPWPWDFLVVDEAHRLKNRHSVLFTTLLHQFRLPHKLLLTGTPIQNTVDEFLALLHFANPQLFAPLEALEAYFKPLDWKTIEGAPTLWMAASTGPSTDALAAALKTISQPFLLRRMKETVLPHSIPPKRERVIYADLAPMQREFYQNLLKSNKLSLTSPALQGQSLQNIVVQLRKTCNHPYLFDNAEPTFDGEYQLGDHILQNSTKLLLLDRILAKLKARGHRVLLYSQMTRMLDILQDYLAWRHYPYERLDGSTRAAERFASVQRFTQDEASFVFLLSSRAGGQGLNLVSADVVIFYDSDWNPSIDQQAEARVHRIGQTKPVLVLKLICRDTVEEFVQRRAQGKSKLQDALLAPTQSPHKPAATHDLTTLHAAILFGIDNLMHAGDPVATDDAELDELLFHTESASLDPVAAAPPSSLSALDYYQYEGNDYREEKKRADASALAALLGPPPEDTLPALAPDDLSPISQRLRTKRQPTAFLHDHLLSPTAGAAPKKQKGASPGAAGATTKKQEEAWRAAGYQSSVIPPQAPTKDLNADLDGGEAQLEFKYGDVCHPQGPGPAVIAVCMDNSGRWRDRGLFSSLTQLCSGARAVYTSAKTFNNLKVGQLHMTPMFQRASTAAGRKNTWIGFLIAQKFIPAKTWAVPPIQQSALRECLTTLAAFAQQHGAAVHMPRIGAKTNFNWYGAEKVIRQVFSGTGVPVYIYYFSSFQQLVQSNQQEVSSSSSTSLDPIDEPEDDAVDSIDFLHQPTLPYLAKPPLVNPLLENDMMTLPPLVTVERCITPELSEDDNPTTLSHTPPYFEDDPLLLPSTSPDTEDLDTLLSTSEDERLDAEMLSLPTLPFISKEDFS